MSTGSSLVRFSPSSVRWSQPPLAPHWGTSYGVRYLRKGLLTWPWQPAGVTRCSLVPETMDDRSDDDIVPVRIVRLDVKAMATASVQMLPPDGLGESGMVGVVPCQPA